MLCVRSCVEFTVGCSVILVMWRWALGFIKCITSFILGREKKSNIMKMNIYWILHDRLKSTCLEKTLNIGQKLVCSATLISALWYKYILKVFMECRHCSIVLRLFQTIKLQFPNCHCYQMYYKDKKGYSPSKSWVCSQLWNYSMLPLKPHVQHGNLRNDIKIWETSIFLPFSSFCTQ